MHGFFAAQGILTAEGGKASHAALVARGMGKPCVAGASALRIDLEARRAARGRHRAARGRPDRDRRLDRPGDRRRRAARRARGRRRTSRPCSAGPTRSRRLGVRANADTPEDARRAREFGAEGIGLCRTEHMFMAADRQPKMQAMIMAESADDRRAALAELLPLQQRGLRGPVRGDGRPAGDHPAARPAAARVPAQRRGARGRARARARASGRATCAGSSARSTACARSRRPTRCSARAARGWGSSRRRSTTCRSRRSSPPRARCASGTGEPPQVEIMLPLVAYEQEVADPARARRARDRRDGRRATCGR